VAVHDEDLDLVPYLVELLQGERVDGVRDAGGLVLGGDEDRDAAQRRAGRVGLSGRGGSGRPNAFQRCQWQLPPRCAPVPEGSAQVPLAFYKQLDEQF
jgi:hypothetical protein